MEPSEAARVQHEFGVTFEAEWKAWFDIFCCELLQAWFDQHAVLEAQMAHVFDAFDKVAAAMPVAHLKLLIVHAYVNVSSVFRLSVNLTSLSGSPFHCLEQ